MDAVRLAKKHIERSFRIDIVTVHLNTFHGRLVTTLVIQDAQGGRSHGRNVAGWQQIRGGRHLLPEDGLEAVMGMMRQIEGSF